MHLRRLGLLLMQALCAATACLGTHAAMAWGDEGHEAIGLIAEHYLTPTTRSRVIALLKGDASGLVARDIAHEATWADKYRDSDRDSSKVRFRATRDWHFVDLEIDGMDLNRACDGRRPLPAGTPASKGPPDDCIIDKIDQFSSELASPATDTEERHLALQFLLHFVGDLHQPLHASDDHDQGGNQKTANASGIGTEKLHYDWDVPFVARLGASPEEIAQKLIAGIADAERAQWARGSATDWAVETYRISKAHAYGALPAASGDSYYLLSDQYVADATRVTAEQLSKAGVRLAFMLNRDLGP
jgi:hypothetical protein